jgi:hypothetical protein
MLKIKSLLAVLLMKLIIMQQNKCNKLAETIDIQIIFKTKLNINIGNNIFGFHIETKHTY